MLVSAQFAQHSHNADANLLYSNALRLALRYVVVMLLGTRGYVERWSWRTEHAFVSF